MTPQSASRLLIHESPLQVLPSLAVAFGLHEAIILQQIHYWISKPSAHQHEDRAWIYNSYTQWGAQFPFLSVHQIRRAIEHLEAAGVLLAGNFNASTRDRTKWYTIDYAALDAAAVAPPDPDSTPAVLPIAFGTHARPIGTHAPPTGTSARPSGTHARPLPETTPETTAKIISLERAPAPPLSTVENFVLTDPRRQWWADECQLAGIDPAHANLDRETAAFREWHAAHARTPADVGAAWHLWMRRAIAHHQRLNPTRSTPDGNDQSGPRPPAGAALPPTWSADLAAALSAIPGPRGPAGGGPHPPAL